MNVLVRAAALCRGTDLSLLVVASQFGSALLGYIKNVHSGGGIMPEHRLFIVRRGQPIWSSLAG
jgi:hypothetical protein